MDDLPGPPEKIDETDEPVGVTLARWRHRRKIAGQVLGERVGMSQAKISRLETGTANPDPRDVRVLAEELGLPATEVERLVELAERADNQLIDWRTSPAGLADRQRDVRQLEASTKEHRNFTPAVVPGLLQTSEYARALMTALHAQLSDDGIADSPTAAAEAVAARMQRSQILQQPERQFRFVLTESVLRNRVAGPAAMLGQIERLREVAGQANVTVRIIPADADLPTAPYHGFYIADDRCVLVDLFNTSLLSRGRRVVRHYRRVFDSIEPAATSEVGPLFDKYRRLYAQLLLADAAPT
jgi:transcriptional regulator with XRE-family HTH domain